MTKRPNNCMKLDRLWCFQTSLYTKENGTRKPILSMEEESKFGLMVPDMKASGRMENSMAMVGWFIFEEMSIPVSGKTARPTDTENIFINVVLCI